MGGHVIKCGLAPVLIDLMHRGYATAFASNGSASIHDFEIAIAGCTSEDVEAVLPDGRFGTAEETGREMNARHRRRRPRFARHGRGSRTPARRRSPSTPRRACCRPPTDSRTPFTVHVAVGTDTPHTHPAADPAAIGRATHRDFRLFARLVSMLDQGGVYLNVGSAVVMPEVFLKAISVVRNLGCRVENFTTVNLDFLQHYRPRAERGGAAARGRGRPRHRSHRPPRDHRSPDRRRAHRAFLMNDPQAPTPPSEPQAAPPADVPPAVAPPAEQYPFWGYRDVAMLTGLAFVLFIASGPSPVWFTSPRT